MAIYGRCPRCLDLHKKKKVIADKAVVDAYGNVPASEYMAIVKQRDSMHFSRESLSVTYYAELTDSGKFTTAFNASCDCGFEFRFEQRQQLTDAEISGTSTPCTE